MSIREKTHEQLEQRSLTARPNCANLKKIVGRLTQIQWEPKELLAQIEATDDEHRGSPTLPNVGYFFVLSLLCDTGKPKKTFKSHEIAVDV